MKPLLRWWAPVRTGVVMAAVGPLLLAVAPAAHAADPKAPAALCSYEIHDSPSPGWFMTASRGSSTGTGTITCVGALDGKQLAGKPGPFTWLYSYDTTDVPAGGNTCALAGGHGRWHVSLPTTDGTSMDLAGPFTWIGTLHGESHGQFGNHPVEMLYVTAYPGPGHATQDCITNPAGDGELIGPATVG